MLKFERENNAFEFNIGPNGPVIKTSGPGEVPKVVDLEGRFPRRLYEKLAEATSPKASFYGGVNFRRLSRQVDAMALVVTAVDRDRQQWIQLHWMQDLGEEWTTFEIRLRVDEVNKLLQYIDERMTC